MKLSGGRVHTYTTVMWQGVYAVNVPGLDFFTVHDVFKTTGHVLMYTNNHRKKVCL